MVKYQEHTGEVQVEGGLCIRRVPLAYEHPTHKEEDGSERYIPLMDGDRYWKLVEEGEEYRAEIESMDGKEWEQLEVAFFGSKHQKFRDSIMVNGVEEHPESPEHLSELILRNLDNAELPDPNSFTPIPLTSADDDGFGYAVYEYTEWGADYAVPFSKIFASRTEVEEFLEEFVEQ